MHQSIVRAVDDLRRAARPLEHFQEREALAANGACLIADPQAEQCTGFSRDIAPPAATAIVPAREKSGTDFRDFRDATARQEQEPEPTIDMEIRWALARPTLDMTDDEVGYPGLEIHQLVEISAERRKAGFAYPPTDAGGERHLEIARLLRERLRTLNAAAIGFEANAAIGNDFAGPADISVFA